MYICAYSQSLHPPLLQAPYPLLYPPCHPGPIKRLCTRLGRHSPHTCHLFSPVELWIYCSRLRGNILLYIFTVQYCYCISCVYYIFSTLIFVSYRTIEIKALISLLAARSPPVFDPPEFVVSRHCIERMYILCIHKYILYSSVYATMPYDPALWYVTYNCIYFTSYMSSAFSCWLKVRLLCALV